jgi:vacuolar-type H+-ATPase subunit H
LTLDRASIEKKDFPVVERGYDSVAVEAHLRALADEVEEEHRGSRPPAESLAAAVSEQVRGIVDAAEKSAAEIVAGAERDAQDILAHASEVAERARLELIGEARREREQALAQSRDYVSRLSNSMSQMLERLDAMDGELKTLTASLRTGTERLRGELESLEDELEGVITATAGSVAAEDQPLAQGEAAPAAAAAAPSPPPEPEFGDEPIEPVPAPAEFSHPAAEYSPGSAKIGDQPPEDAVVAPEPRVGPPTLEPTDMSAPAGDDSEGARLIALNMALNGTPREETDRYLAANFELQDRERLLDEVYASVQG